MIENKSLIELFNFKVGLNPAFLNQIILDYSDAQP